MTFRPRLPPAMRSALSWTAVVAGYTALVLATYWPIWAGRIEDRRVFGWDCLEQFWPDLVFLHGSFSRGDFPLWNPFERGGYPALADPHLGIYYPLNWVLLGVAGIIGGVPLALMQAKVLGHLVLGATFMNVYARSRGAPKPGAFLAGIMFALSGYMAFSKDLALWTLAWTPLVLLAIDRLVARGTRGSGAALGAAAGIASLAAPPGATFFLVLVAGPYLLFRLAVEPAARRASWPRLTVALAVAAGIFVGLAGVLYGPMAELLPYSDRAERTLGYVMIGSLDPSRITRMLVPSVNGTSSPMYVGALPFFLCALALAAAPRGDKTPYFFAAVGAAALWMAFGHHAAFLERLAIFVPGFDMFRMAERYLLLMGMAAAVLVAYGAAAIDRPDPAQRTAYRGVVVGALIYLALLCGTALTPQLLSKKVADIVKSEGVGQAVLAAALAVGLLGRRIWTQRPLRAVGWGLVVALTMTDLWAGQREWFSIFEPRRTWDRDAELKGFADIDKEWRVFDLNRFEQQVGMRHRVRDFLGYFILPLSFQRYVEVINRASRDPTLLAHFNVRWVFQGSHHRRGPNEMFPQSRMGAFKAVGPGWAYEPPKVAPALMWYPRAEVLPAGKTALDRLAGTAPGTAALVETADLPAAERPRVILPPGAPDPAPRAGRVLELTNNRVVTEIDAPAAGVVVSNEVWYQGWRATVDGKPVPVFRANHLLRAVTVDKGRHRIEWTFRPVRFFVFFPIFVGTLFGLLVWWMSSMRKAHHDRVNAPTVVERPVTPAGA